ncbi:MAG: hypothetical protein ACKOCX_02285, partial [Planctomycetota bacterium]
PDFLDALLLAEADRRGRVRGYAAPTLEAAVAVLRELDAADGVDETGLDDVHGGRANADDAGAAS